MGRSQYQFGWHEQFVAPPQTAHASQTRGEARLRADEGKASKECQGEWWGNGVLRPVRSCYTDASKCHDEQAAHRGYLAP